MIIRFTILSFFIALSVFISGYTFIDNTNTRSLNTGWYYITSTPNDFPRKMEKSEVYYYIEPNPIVTAKNITKLKIYKSYYGNLGLEMQLDSLGTIIWKEATEKAVGNQLAFILDNKLMFAPKIINSITNGMTVLNMANTSRKRLKEIKKIIKKEKRGTRK